VTGPPVDHRTLRMVLGFPRRGGADLRRFAIHDRKVRPTQPHRQARNPIAPCGC